MYFFITFNLQFKFHSIDFPKVKINIEREKISDCGQDGEYDTTADGDPKENFADCCGRGTKSITLEKTKVSLP